jgi:SAM-dependent methyltransferase
MHFQSLIGYLSSFILPNSTVKTWKNRSSQDAIGYLDLLKGDSSSFLWERYENDFPSEVLELGCNSGSRIFSAASKFPSSYFTGVDINLESIEIARSYAQKNNFKNVNFISFDITKTNELFDKLQNKKFDLIYTWATLIYIHPKNIEKILKKMIIHGTKVTLIEQHNSNLNFFYKGFPTNGGNNWVRNYQKLIAKFEIQNVAINVTKVPNAIWQPGGGHAHLVELK